MKRFLVCLVGVSLLLLVMNVGGNAQPILAGGVIGNGGLMISNSGNQLIGTLGQSLIGHCACPSHTNSLGFWYARSGLVTGVIRQQPEYVPTEFRLEQNYPNPFNPTTGIRVQLSGDREMRLVVYDLLGREVAVLANGRYVAGVHTFTFDGTNLASGPYMYRLTAGAFSAIRKMLLVR